MKVIAKVNEKEYICKVNHDELEKFLNLFYGKLNPLKVNDEIDLSKGYNFYREIGNICNTMEESIKAYRSNQDTLLAFINIFKEQKNEDHL
jgi:hypothetical protein